MTVELHWSIPLPAVETGEQHKDATASHGAPSASPLRHLRPIGRWLWNFLVNAISGSADGGLDDTAFPSGYNVPYKRGSRGVRNLWHQPF